jgi:serine/threonine-protein kinase
VANENWERVKEVFEAALRRSPEERAEFLAAVCPDDDSVRREVESLLCSFDRAEGFMKRPIVGEIGKAATAKKHTLPVGHLINHYEIIELIGIGGMGEVYLAMDQRLGRRVALKFLPADGVSSQEANQRFWREARAAATLDHPHICAIHEIAESEGASFIVMQYVEGETLAEKLKREPMSLREVLDIAVQVADGLAEAHAHGIIHRDIKPANVIVNDKGQAKVLDFGLAKFATEKTETARLATAKQLSRPGAIMGTVPFMSPEQARGGMLDARADIFSFGAMLYEMACGRTAFARDSDAETISAILRDEPSLTEFPAALQPVVQKCLMKEAVQRYQTAQDLLFDLKSLQKRLEIEVRDRAAPNRFVVPAAGGEPTGARTGRQEPRPTLSAEYLLTEIKRHKFVTAGGLILLLAAIAGTVSFNYLRPPTIENKPIKSLAVLPFKSLTPGTSDQYLGLGIADSIIAKTSQIKGLTVRPTSAVRRYVNAEIDSLEAAREQQVETVLDGTIQQSGERLRVSVNLLNASDGSLLWAETFNLSFIDIFKMQDEVSRQVAARLRLKLSGEEAARIAQHDSSNPEAYKYYAKAMYHVGNINASLSSRPEADLAVDLFKKAVELDPEYAVAHAQLGYTYTRIAVFLEDNLRWIELARQELALAEHLNPQLAEVHAARFFSAFSQYEGWQIETALRELRLAQAIDPDVAHMELGDLCAHVGLEDEAIEQFEAALRVDPNNETAKNGYIISFYQANRPDVALQLSKKLFNRAPDAQYYLEKMMAREAEPLIDNELKKDTVSDETRIDQIQLLSLQGKHDEAQTKGLEFLKTVRRNRGYHHYTYYIARVFAHGGKSAEAVKWLRYTAENGFPCYTLFERDPYLNPIRRAPEFIRFIAEMKDQFERHKRAFAQ